MKDKRSCAASSAFVLSRLGAMAIYMALIQTIAFAQNTQSGSTGKTATPTPTQSSAKTSKSTSKAANPALTTVLISTDLDCTITVDDNASTKQVSAQKVTTIKLSRGEHLLVATTNDQMDTWRQVVDIHKPGQKVVSIALLPIQQAREQDESAKAEAARADAQAAADQSAAAADQAAAEQEQRTRARQDAERQQTISGYQTQIDELRSQIDGLQDDIDKNLEDAQKYDQNADEWTQTCATVRGYCMYAMYIVNSRTSAETCRQTAASDKDQMRTLQRQQRELERKVSALQ